jgi:hypothetical protein
MTFLPGAKMRHRGPTGKAPIDRFSAEACDSTRKGRPAPRREILRDCASIRRRPHIINARPAHFAPPFGYGVA